MIRRRKKKDKRDFVTRFSRFLERNPQARPWLELRLIPRVAAALCNAGIYSLEQLGALSREDFLSIWGAGEPALVKCEKALGRRLPSEREYWEDRGITGLAAGVLMRQGIKSVEQLQAMDREEVLMLAGMGPVLIAHVEKALGIHFQTPLDYWLEQGFYKATAKILHRAGILTLEHLAERKAELTRLGLNALELHQVEVVLRRTRWRRPVS